MFPRVRPTGAIPGDLIITEHDGATQIFGQPWELEIGTGVALAEKTGNPVSFDLHGLIVRNGLSGRVDAPLDHTALLIFDAFGAKA